MASPTFLRGPRPNTVRQASGEVCEVPEGWGLLLPGDAGLTRRVKAAGEHWVVQEKVGRSGSPLRLHSLRALPRLPRSVRVLNVHVRVYWRKTAGLARFRGLKQRLGAESAAL